MAGSLRLVRSPDVYELRVYVGRDSSGRVKHRYERFTGNKRAAQRALAALVAEVEQAKEVEVEPGNIWSPATTLNAAFAAWKLNGWQDLSPSVPGRWANQWPRATAPTPAPTSVLVCESLVTQRRRWRLQRARGQLLPGQSSIGRLPHQGFS